MKPKQIITLPKQKTGPGKKIQATVFEKAKRKSDKFKKQTKKGPLKESASRETYVTGPIDFVWDSKEELSEILSLLRVDGIEVEWVNKEQLSGSAILRGYKEEIKDWLVHEYWDGSEEDAEATEPGLFSDSPASGQSSGYEYTTSELDFSAWEGDVGVGKKDLERLLSPKGVKIRWGSSEQTDATMILSGPKDAIRDYLENDYFDGEIDLAKETEPGLYSDLDEDSGSPDSRISDAIANSGFDFSKYDEGDADFITTKIFDWNDWSEEELGDGGSKIRSELEAAVRAKLGGTSDLDEDDFYEPKKTEKESRKLTEKEFSALDSNLARAFEYEGDRLELDPDKLQQIIDGYYFVVGISPLKNGRYAVVARDDESARPKYIEFSAKFDFAASYPPTITDITWGRDESFGSNPSWAQDENGPWADQQDESTNKSKMKKTIKEGKGAGKSVTPLPKKTTPKAGASKTLQQSAAKKAKGKSDKFKKTTRKSPLKESADKVASLKKQIAELECEIEDLTGNTQEIAKSQGTTPGEIRAQARNQKERLKKLKADLKTTSAKKPVSESVDPSIRAYSRFLGLSTTGGAERYLREGFDDLDVDESSASPGGEDEEYFASAFGEEFEERIIDVVNDAFENFQILLHDAGLDSDVVLSQYAVTIGSILGRLATQMGN